MVNMGSRIRELRVERRLTQSEVARRMGISKSMLSSYEASQRSPSYKVLVKIALFFSVSTDYLLGIEKPSIAYDGLSEREMRAIMNLIDIFRDK